MKCKILNKEESHTALNDERNGFNGEVCILQYSAGRFNGPVIDVSEEIEDYDVAIRQGAEELIHKLGKMSEPNGSEISRTIVEENGAVTLKIKFWYQEEGVESEYRMIKCIARGRLVKDLDTNKILFVVSMSDMLAKEFL